MIVKEKPKHAGYCKHSPDFLSLWIEHVVYDWGRWLSNFGNYVGLRGFFFIRATVGTGGTNSLVVVCGYVGVFFICYTVGTYCLISLVIISRKSMFVLISCTVGTDGCHFDDCGEIVCFLYFLFCRIWVFKW